MKLLIWVNSPSDFVITTSERPFDPIYEGEYIGPTDACIEMFIEQASMPGLPGINLTVLADVLGLEIEPRTELEDRVDFAMRIYAHILQQIQE